MISKLSFKSLLTGVAGAALAVGLVMTPVSIDIQDGQLVLTPSAAYAKDHRNSNKSNNNSNKGDEDDDDDDDKDDMDDMDDDKDDMDDMDDMDDDKDDMDDDKDDMDDDHMDDDSADDGENDDHDNNSRPADLSEFLNSLRNGSTITSAESESGKIEIVYSDGWKEKIENNRYMLTDPSGNTIVSRDVNVNDLTRLNSVF
jgi:hypothetical protein